MISAATTESPASVQISDARLPSWTDIWQIALALFALETISNLLNAASFKMSSVSLVWLPNGLLIGVLLCRHRRQWPFWLALGFVIDLIQSLMWGGSLITASFYGMCNTVEVCLAAFFTRPFLTPNADLTIARQLRAFLLYAVTLAPAITASAATFYLHFHNGTPFSHSARAWFAADVLGIATITPLYLSHHHRWEFSHRSSAEIAILFTLLCGMTVGVFGYSSYATIWIVQLLLLYLGIRLGFSASALGLLVVISAGGYLTIMGRGPLGEASNHSLANRMLFFQFFVAMSMVALYVTEVAMSANRRAQNGLQESEARYRRLADDLELRVDQRTRELQEQIAEREIIQQDLVNAKLLAEESNRAKSAFLANMSHELRTPLNAILGYSELLQEDAVSREDNEGVEDLKKIQIAGNHLLSLINDVLDISKIEAGSFQLFHETVSVATVIGDVAATIEPLARLHNNMFLMEIGDSDILVSVDVIKFRQCLLNLLGNACKFTKDGTIRLSVKTAEVEGRTEIRWIVSDTGIGIAESDREHIFEAFSQVDSSTTRRHIGTGLGLAISQRLVLLMGGYIGLQSELGQGSIFTIHLPQNLPLKPAGSEARANMENANDHRLPVV